MVSFNSFCVRCDSVEELREVYVHEYLCKTCARSYENSKKGDNQNQMFQVYKDKASTCRISFCSFEGAQPMLVTGFRPLRKSGRPNYRNPILAPCPFPQNSFQQMSKSKINGVTQDDKGPDRRTRSGVTNAKRNLSTSRSVETTPPPTETLRTVISKQEGGVPQSAPDLTRELRREAEDSVTPSKKRRLGMSGSSRLPGSLLADSNKRKAAHASGNTSGEYGLPNITGKSYSKDVSTAVKRLSLDSDDEDELKNEHQGANERDRCTNSGPCNDTGTLSDEMMEAYQKGDQAQENVACTARAFVEAINCLLLSHAEIVDKLFQQNQRLMKEKHLLETRSRDYEKR